MQAARTELIALENRFWQSMVDEETDVALAMLAEPSFMVSPHGAMKFDHATYRRMAEQGSQVLERYTLGEMDVTFIGVDTAVLSYPVTQVVATRATGEETEQAMTDTSTWVRLDGAWRCVMHTETPVSPDKG